jgi:hypothetical protein
MRRIWEVSKDEVWAAGTGCGHGACPYARWDGASWKGAMEPPPAGMWMIPVADRSAGGSIVSWALGNDLWTVPYDGSVLHATRR